MSQWCSARRVETGEESSQVVRLHGTAEPEPRGARFRPATRCLARIRVVRRRCVGQFAGRIDALVFRLEEIGLLAGGELGD